MYLNGEIKTRKNPSIPFYAHIIITSARGKFIRRLGVKINRINRLLIVPMNLEGFRFHLHERRPGQEKLEIYWMQQQNFLILVID